MKDINAIEVHNLKKMFKVYYDKGSQLKERLLFKKRNWYEERWVLNGIDFEVKKGEAVGLIGHNGCGKSTTLKLLSRIIYPDYGTVEMRGRVSSLIELGAGFHPDMSGRENIYINAAIFGLGKKEINRRLSDIIEFSELGDFIDNPVRTYSSGMYMRLAFSVAINVDADILLIDEILAVGDINFQNKCFKKIRQLKDEGTTIVIVSHSMSQIEQICDRSIWLNDGKIIADGKTVDVDAYYRAYMEGERKNQIEKKINEGEDDELSSKVKMRWGSEQIVIKNFRLCNSRGEEASIFSTDEELVIIFELDNIGDKRKACIGIGIIRDDGTYCYGTNTVLDKIGYLDLKQTNQVELIIPKIGLLPAGYYLDFEVKDENNETQDYIRKAVYIEMMSDIEDVGVVRIEHIWNYQ